MNWQDCPWRIKVAMIKHPVCDLSDSKCLMYECSLVKLSQRIEKLEHQCDVEGRSKKGGDKND